MKIQKKYLEVLFCAVRDCTGLGLVEARVRDSFLLEITPAVDKFFVDRKKIYEHFCNKKADGTPDLLEGTKYVFAPEVTKEINEALEVLFAEEEEIAVTDGTIAKFISATEYKPKVGESKMIDEIIELMK